MIRLTLSLMNRPRITTVRSRCCGRLNSLMPISRKVFLPAGGAFGMSFALRLVGDARHRVGRGHQHPVVALLAQASGHADDLDFLVGAGAPDDQRDQKDAINTGRIIPRGVLRLSTRHGERSPRSGRLALALACSRWRRAARSLMKPSARGHAHARRRWPLRARCRQRSHWLLLRLETFAGGSVPAESRACRARSRLAQLTDRCSPIASCCSSMRTKCERPRSLTAPPPPARSESRDPERARDLSTDRRDAARCDAASDGCMASSPIPIRWRFASRTDRRPSNGSKARTGAT